jgi:hypothetical protein
LLSRFSPNAADERTEKAVRELKFAGAGLREYGSFVVSPFFRKTGLDREQRSVIQEDICDALRMQKKLEKVKAEGMS